MKKLSVLIPLVVAAVLAMPLSAQAKAVPRKTGVVIVGDSISYRSAGPLKNKFRHGFSLTLQVYPGVTMADQYPAVEALAETDPWAFVIELGSDDIYDPTSVWQTAFANEVGALASQRCVVMLTLPVKFGAVAVGLDGAIAITVSTHPNVHALDWGVIGYSNPKWVEPDGVHPTVAGSKELAKVMLAAVRQDCTTPDQTG